jgi:hypothetical protein
MGIRVHKVIGYGVDDLQHDGRRMTDPRIDWGRLQKKMDKAYDIDAEAFLKWCVRHKREIQLMEESEGGRVHWKNLPWLLEESLKRMIKDKFYWTLGSCLIHDEEFGIPGVMLFLPVDSNWKRYDDTIDWVEETACHKQESRVVRLEHGCESGIYPYNGFMVRFRDPEPGIMADEMGDILRKWVEHCGPGVSKSDDKGFTFLSARLHEQLMNTKQENRKLYDHFRNDWRPMMPPELMPVLLWFKDCFTDLKALTDSLKPLLYVYWS